MLEDALRSNFVIYFADNPAKMAACDYEPRVCAIDLEYELFKASRLANLYKAAVMKKGFEIKNHTKRREIHAALIPKGSSGTRETSEPEKDHNPFMKVSQMIGLNWNSDKDNVAGPEYNPPERPELDASPKTSETVEPEKSEVPSSSNVFDINDSDDDSLDNLPDLRAIVSSLEAKGSIAKVTSHEPSNVGGKDGDASLSSNPSSASAVTPVMDEVPDAPEAEPTTSSLMPVNVPKITYFFEQQRCVFALRQSLKTFLG